MPLKDLIQIRAGDVSDLRLRTNEATGTAAQQGVLLTLPYNFVFL